MQVNIDNLFHYIENGENDLVKGFLEYNNIDLKDHEGRTAIINASFYNNIELMEWLIKNNSDINIQDKNGYNALHFACQESNLECVKILLKNKIETNAVDKDGNTPAWVTVMNWKGGKNFDVLKELYKNKADFEIKNKAGNSVEKIVPKEIMEKIKD